ncbi:hypothetical protein TrCOL_g9556, partial [Triparma columacea]
PYHVQPPPSRATKTQDDDYSSSSDADNDNYHDSDDRDSEDDELEGDGGVENAFEDPSRDYSGAATATRQATFYFHKRWFETMMGLKDDEALPDASLDLKVITLPRAKAFIRVDLERTNQHTSMPRFTSQDSYIKNQIRHLSRLYWWGYNEKG